MTEPRFWKDKSGNPYSVYPPTTYLTFAYWIYMVPQYKPESILILGYAGGSTAGLIRLLYGNVPITGVDISPCENMYGVNFVQADAKEFVKTCGHFDTVIVDLFEPDSPGTPCAFITSKSFVQDLKRIANYIIINSLHIKDMSAYNEFRKIGINKPSGSAEQIYYYEVKGPIPNLHPWK